MTTDVTTADEEQPEQEHDVTVVHDASADATLRFLVELANGTAGVEIGLTLTLRGAIINGTLIGYKTWVDELEAQTADAGELAAAFGRALCEGLRGDYDAQEQRNFPVQHIHLRDVRIVAGSEVAFAPIWRGRLAAVDGWLLGQQSDV